MEFLKAFFGDKAITYDELVQAINAYNGDEKNKEKLIKMLGVRHLYQQHSLQFVFPTFSLVLNALVKT